MTESILRYLESLKPIIGWALIALTQNTSLNIRSFAERIASGIAGFNRIAILGNLCSVLAGLFLFSSVVHFFILMFEPSFIYDSFREGFAVSMCLGLGALIGAMYLSTKKSVMRFLGLDSGVQEFEQILDSQNNFVQAAMTSYRQLEVEKIKDKRIKELEDSLMDIKQLMEEMKQNQPKSQPNNLNEERKYSHPKKPKTSRL